MNRNRFFAQIVKGGLAAGALAVSATPVFAGDKEKPERVRDAARLKEALEERKPGLAALAKRRAAHGTIKSISGTSFVLETAAGDLTVTTDAQTTYRLPETQNETFASLATGMRVLVVGERPSETTMLARRVQGIPAGLRKRDDEDDDEREKKRNRAVVNGAVSELSAVAGGTRTFKVTPSGADAGAPVTITQNEKTVTSLVGFAALANGANVKVAYAKDGDRNIARRIHVKA